MEQQQIDGRKEMNLFFNLPVPGRVCIGTRTNKNNTVTEITPRCAPTTTESLEGTYLEHLDQDWDNVHKGF